MGELLGDDNVKALVELGLTGSKVEGLERVRISPSKLPQVPMGASTPMAVSGDKLQ